MDNELDYHILFNSNIDEITIFIHLFNDIIDLELIEITVPFNYTILNILEYVETYYIGYENSITLINVDQGVLFGDQVIIEDMSVIDIQMINTITEDRFIIEDNIFTQVFKINNIQQKITKETIEEYTNTLTYNKIDSNKYKIDSCSICKIPFEDNNYIRVLNCEHFFHKDCIDQWLLNYDNTCCPICKKKVI